MGWILIVRVGVGASRQRERAWAKARRQESTGQVTHTSVGIQVGWRGEYLTDEG